MDVIRIDHLESEQLAPYARLTERQLQDRLHPEGGLFICESMKVIQVALAHGMEPVSFLCEEKFLPQVESLLTSTYCCNSIDCAEGGSREVPVYTAAREVLARLTGYELSRGVLCCMRRPQLPGVGEVLRGAHRVAVIDSVVNSENIGAIFRAAASLGMDGVLLTRTCCDPLNRRACRVSMGTVFQLPWTWLDGINNEEFGMKNYPEVLRELGFKTVALALTDRSVSINDPVLKSPPRLAIIMGTEGDGLTDSVLRMADYVARIPMQRGVDSLNVAAAAAVAFWELRR